MVDITIDLPILLDNRTYVLKMTAQQYFLTISVVCVCVRERERERVITVGEGNDNVEGGAQ